MGLGHFFPFITRWRSFTCTSNRRKPFTVLLTGNPAGKSNFWNGENKTVCAIFAHPSKISFLQICVWHMQRPSISSKGNLKQWVSQLQLFATPALCGFRTPSLATAEIIQKSKVMTSLPLKNRRKSLAFIMRCKLSHRLCLLGVAWSNAHRS